jgi:hypothetical protein
MIPCNHGGAVRPDTGMDVANQPTSPPGASSEGVGRGWFARVLLMDIPPPYQLVVSLPIGSAFALSNFDE